MKPGLRRGGRQGRACGGRRGERAEEAAAVLWSAGNGSGTASASATVTASSCAECLVGDGSLPAALRVPPLACCAPAGALPGRGRDAHARAFSRGDGPCLHPVVLGNHLQL